MRRLLLPLVLLLGAPAPAQAADVPALQIEFLQPQNFTDAHLGRERPRGQVDQGLLDQLRRHLQRRAAPRLDGRQLHLSFTDIDLAGDYEPTADPDLHGVRVVRSVYPPRLRFDHRLQDADGQVLAAGAADLRDLGFDSASGGVIADPLRHEKRLLDRWLADILGATH